jgi:hypothetical protein
MRRAEVIGAAPRGHVASHHGAGEPKEAPPLRRPSLPDELARPAIGLAPVGAQVANPRLAARADCSAVANAAPSEDVHDRARLVGARVESSLTRHRTRHHELAVLRFGDVPALRDHERERAEHHADREAAQGVGGEAHQSPET